MPKLTKKQQELVSLAQKGGIKNSDVFLLDKIQTVDDKVDQNKTDLEQQIEEVSNSVPNLNDLVGSLKGIPGEPGHTPTDNELLDLIKPLIPQVKDGKTPTKEELLALIRPLIPNVKDGETPSDGRLLALIKPLIPEPIPGKDADETKIIETIENDLPKLGSAIRDSLELLQEDERLDISAIKDLQKLLDELKKQPTRIGGGGFSYMAMDQHIIDDETPTNSGDSLNFTINHAPSPVASLKVFRNGQRLRITEDYTFSGKTITLLVALNAGEILLVDYRI